MNTLIEVKEKVDKGITVYWKTLNYKVVRKGVFDYYLKSSRGALTYLSNNFNPSDFFIKNN